MTGHVSVSAKIPAESKAKLKEHGINLNRLINEAVIQEIRRLEDEEYRQLLKKAANVLQKIPEEHLVELIRTGRDER
jgi:post-segregation antitoxin (ccd killing protein)